MDANVSTLSNRSVTDEIDEINAAQADFGEEDQIVFRVTKAMFEDFFNSSSTSAENSHAILSLFEEHCMCGIETLRKLSLRSSKDIALSLNLRHLVSEYRAYTLLRQLAELEESSERLTDDIRDSVLGDLIGNDEEFRRLLVLLQWCEENENSDPRMLKELDEEMAVLEKSCDIRVETLHDRKQGKKLCDLDLDGAKHGRLHGDDEDMQNRVYRAVYMLLRCGRIDEGCELLERSGLSALVPSLKLRKVARNPALTPKSEEKPQFGLAISRALFKHTMDEILSVGDSLSPLENRIWCITAGRLEPLLSSCSRTDERLWCFANAAVECRIDSRLSELHGWESDAETSLSGSDLMVDSIFDEILTKERSPFYSSYRFLLTGNAAGHVEFMKNWLEEHPDSRYPHLLRFMVHTILIYTFEEREFNVEDAHWVVECYISLLISMKLYSLVPFYVSHLSPERMDSVLVSFMYTLDEEQSRLEVLGAAHKAGIDTSLLCRKIYAHAVKMNPITDDSTSSDVSLVKAWNWLTFSGKDLIVDMLIGADYILRRFFYFDKLKEARLLLKQSNENVAVLVESLWKKGFPDQPIPRSLVAQIAEYNAYISYLEALNCFDNWFKQFAREVPEVPERPSDEVWARMDIQQKASFELQHKKMEEAKQRHEANIKFLFNAAYGSLMDVLRQPNGWLNCFLESRENNCQIQRNAELKAIRERYIATAVTLLQTVCEQSKEKLKSLDVLVALTDSDYKLTQILSKEQLRIFLRKFSLFVGLELN